MKIKQFAFCLAGFLSVFSCFADQQNAELNPRNFVVELTARTDSRPSIVLHWTLPFPSKEIRVSRRNMGEQVWPPPVVLAGEAVQFEDLNIEKGKLYEYKVERFSETHIARGYICSGFEIPLMEDRGRIILITERTCSGKLKFELDRLVLDLIGDGWDVTRQDVSRDDTVVDVKKIIVSEYRKDPVNTKALFLFGHVPVPYSGDIMPDGHSDHRGAWPADVYYADMEGKWTDELKIDTAKPPPASWNTQAIRLRNVENDGKFDQSLPPGRILMMEGRVDLSSMPAFGMDEYSLLKRYLDKEHGFRHGYVKFKQQGLVNDGFGFFQGEAFASSAWRNYSTFFGSAVKEGNMFAFPDESFIWAFGCGGGGMKSAGGVGETADFAKSNAQIAFTMLFGSIFGDWDGEDNFLRAPLAATSGLTCAWAGRPHWYLHHMAMGFPIGYSCMRTQGNKSGDYQHSDFSGKPADNKDGGEQDTQSNLIHVALMGDPTLRLHTVLPVTGLRADMTAGKMTLCWDESDETDVIGYLVYRSDELLGGYSRLTPEEPIQESRFIDPSTLSPGYYMVRTVKLQASASGSYLNLSQGTFIRVTASGGDPAPEASDFKLTTMEDTPITQSFSGETTAGKDIVRSIVAQPKHGAVTINGSSFTYSPAKDFNGEDDFLFVASNGIADSSPARVAISVTPVNDPPEVLEQLICLTDDLPRNITLTGKDKENSNLTFNITGEPKHNILSGKAPTMALTPGKELFYQDEFQFTASDGELTSEPAAIRIFPVNICSKAEPITVDGDLSDWDSLPFECKKPTGFGYDKPKWKGPQDSSFAFGVRYDDNNLYVGVKVTDNQIIAAGDQILWWQDAIEIRIDARPKNICSSGKGQEEMKDFILIGLSPSPAGAKWVYDPAKFPLKTQYICVPCKGGYNVEIALPLSYLNEKAGGEWWGFRMNVSVDDRDSDGLVQICWFPDWRRNESVPGSGLFLRK